MFAFLPGRTAEAAREHAHLIELLENADPAEVERFARWHKLQTSPRRDGVVDVALVVVGQNPMLPAWR
jgi:hypothetical protein